MRDEVLGMINGAWMSQAIAVACELAIPDRLAAGPRDAESLAADTGIHAASMRRFLRALCSIEVCEERANGAFELGRAGDWLRGDRRGSLHGWAILSRRRLWGLWSDLHAGRKTGESVRRRRHGFDDYGELQSDAQMATVFNRAMVSITEPVARALAAHDSFDDCTCIVDVGGGAGHLLSSVLEAHPRLRGIVYDLAHARGIAEETLRGRGLADRAVFMEGSFFDAVPPEGDAYLMKSVLHNWDDDRASRILERCAGAMRRESRLMILERVMPERISSAPEDREAVRSDLQMLLGCDGCERTQAQFDALLRGAGLQAKGVMALTRDFSLIEAAIA